ncbi:ribonuclease P protein component [Maribellus mangrovi]|uniref:ribonuclease P protein component n=1 Tax=Maribellus mangrovi TaxID=3133146 RepID=UPI0030ED50D2
MENKSEIKTTPSYSFKKDERLCSKKIIDRLFSEGQTFLAFPLKVVFLSTPLNTSSPVQAGFTVSKKNFKQAVKRNRIKRLMREAYRLNKNELYLELGEQQLAVFFIYIGKEMPVYSKVESAIKKAFRQISINLQKD